MPTPLLSALRAATPLHNGAVKHGCLLTLHSLCKTLWAVVADAHDVTQDSLRGACRPYTTTCRRYTRLSRRQEHGGSAAPHNGSSAGKWWLRLLHQPPCSCRWYPGSSSCYRLGGLRTMAPQLANDGYVSCTSHRAPAAGIQGQAVVTDLAGSAQCLLSWQMVATSLAPARCLPTLHNSLATLHKNQVLTSHCTQWWAPY